MRHGSHFDRIATGALTSLARLRPVARNLFSMIALRDHWDAAVSDEVRFLALCGAMNKLAHAQLLQDLWVLFETNMKPSGYFVEFGAYDGATHSNTKLLEERFNWTGILVEPNPDMLPRLQAIRSSIVDGRCVWDTSGDLVTLTITEDAALSSVLDQAAHDWHTHTRRATAARQVSVRTVTLDELLDGYNAPEHFDFLSVDTEGTELRVLQGFDFARHRPHLVAVEHNRRADLRDLDGLMLRKGYERRFEDISKWDAWYRSRDGVAYT